MVNPDGERRRLPMGTYVPGLPIAEREKAAVRELHRKGILVRTAAGWQPIAEKHFPALARLLTKYNLERITPTKIDVLPPQT